MSTRSERFPSTSRVAVSAMKASPEATVADGTSRLDNIAPVRLKESDRVSAMLQLNRRRFTAGTNPPDSPAALTWLQYSDVTARPTAGRRDL